ncbi:UbiA prenyltransferase family [Trametes meyenii]|nr:UbiA prenyltransferase family [Trametes meyenii]
MSSSVHPLDVGHFLYTLYLFTRSDLKTIVVPTTLFGTVASPFSPTVRQVLLRGAWVWLGLLQVDVANQIINPAEDMINKPWRPLPAKRISHKHAFILRWLTPAVWIALSFILHVPAAGIALTISNIFYHELGGAEHWLSKNICNAAGYASFNAGATGIMSPPLSISPASVRAQTLNALLILTTIHAQDFQDAEGDKASGRSTLPIAYPWLSRLSMLLILPAWSLYLSYTWSADLMFAVPFIALGTFVALGFFRNYGGPSERDHSIYRLFNVWLCCVHVCPFLF